MDFEQLRLFREVVERGSFSRAGQRLHLSRSAVSLKIKRLEEDFGCVLLDRRGRAGSRLTPEGRLVLAYCSRVLDLTEDLTSSLLALGRRGRGSVSVGATLTAHIYLLPPLVKEFSRLNPGIGVAVVGGFVPDLLSSVDRGDIDVALVWAPVDERLFRCAWVADDEIVPVAPPAHRLAGRPAVAPSDLDEFPVVLSAPRSMSRRFIMDRLQAAGARLRHPVEFGTPAAIKEAVLAGLGIGFLSPLAVRAELAAGRLVRLPLGGVNLTRQLVLASSRREPPSPAAERFSQYLCRAGRPAAAECRPAPGVVAHGAPVA